MSAQIGISDVVSRIFCAAVDAIYYYFSIYYILLSVTLLWCTFKSVLTQYTISAFASMPSWKRKTLKRLIYKLEIKPRASCFGHFLFLPCDYFYIKVKKGNDNGIQID